MKKVLKVVILSILLILGMFIVNQKSEAVTLDMNYSFSNDENSQKNQKVKNGDEISIAITVNGEENGKIMAIFGYLYYDKDVLELVPSSDDENSADIQLGTGWSIGNLSLGNTTAEENETEEKEQPKFLIYSNDENREDTAVYVKFKVKDEKKFKNTEVSIKQITLYDSEHREIQSNIEDSVLKMSDVKIGNKSSKNVMKIVIISILIIVVLCGIGVFIKKKQKELKEEKSNFKNEKVEENKEKNEKKEVKKIEKKIENKELKEDKKDTSEENNQEKNKEKEEKSEVNKKSSSDSNEKDDNKDSKINKEDVKETKQEEKEQKDEKSKENNEKKKK